MANARRTHRADSLAASCAIHNHHVIQAPEASQRGEPGQLKPLTSSLVRTPHLIFERVSFLMLFASM